MERIIKFRAWDGEKMVYELFTKVPVKGSEIHIEVNAYLMKWEILMQYTGLHDKNGTEIFEGDVVKCKHGKFGVIKYDNSNQGGGRFYPFTDNGLFCEIFDDKERWYYLEVIGNIYSNPELIK